MRPIGKGARFLVLTGESRGLEFTVNSETPDDRGWWTLDVPGHPRHYGTTAQLEGPGFKRLPDAPTPLG